MSMIGVTRQVLDDALLADHARDLGMDQTAEFRLQQKIWREFTFYQQKLARIARNGINEKVLEDGQIYTEDFCGSFSRNFFERKLLLSDDSRSFAIRPLKANGETVGLIGYSSEDPTAFAMFEQGETDYVTEKFAQALHERAYAD